MVAKKTDEALLSRNSAPAGRAAAEEAGSGTSLDEVPLFDARVRVDARSQMVERARKPMRNLYMGGGWGTGVLGDGLSNVTVFLMEAAAESLGGGHMVLISSKRMQ